MYPFKKIESKWSVKWQKSKLYEPNLKTAKKPYYNLMMFPYPSAEGLHVGNMYAFVGSDIHGRFKRMNGFDVFEPIGLDGFGIHSENYAMKIGAHPTTQAKRSEKNFYRQLQAIGSGFAWDEHLETYDPEYYKWTQWVFIQMFKRGLAYRKKALVNWCPSCQTVLADEQVINGKCERCGTETFKKDLEQWFFKITKYADRLLKNLDNIDWSERIKIAQRNWIGKSEGALIKFEIRGPNFGQLEVFTTRPDTLFGATYLVLAPEHKIIENLKIKIENWDAVQKYILRAKKKSEADRTAEGGQVFGVELAGIKVINPANGMEIPVYVADYVIGSYGTGAVMAVPAHDQRDFEFAKKFSLPIKPVINISATRDDAKHIQEFEPKRKIVAVVENGKGELLTLNWGPKLGGRLFIGGTIEQGEFPLETAKREILEETGFYDLEHIHTGEETFRYRYFAYSKNKAFEADTNFVHFKLRSDMKKDTRLEKTERGNFEVQWISPQKADAEITENLHRYALEKFIMGRAYVGEGWLFNSGKFDGMDSEEAKWKITEFVKGERKTNFRLRDWLISRQRYWGPPIPMINCDDCGWQPVPDKDLPVKLPFVKDFRPTGSGVSPLASVKSFYKVKCPKCGKGARRETDVSDTFLDSSWYFFRYIDTKNKKAAFDKKIAKKWLPAEMYIGGAEHAVLHLLYTRFVTMVFNDMGLIDFDEPFKKFRAHGLLIKEGMKMSKSKGNVVNPDEYIKKFGADTLRAYLMFLGPFQQGGDWRDEGIMGIVRFLNRVYSAGSEFAAMKRSKKENVSDWMHAHIKSVTEDITNLSYNTCISEMMIAFKRIEEGEDKNPADFEALLKLLAPFAPHIAEELWAKLGHNPSTRAKHGAGRSKSIHLETWPKFDASKFQAKTFELIIQINGRVRGKTTAKFGLAEAEAKELAMKEPNFSQYIAGNNIKKVIFVPNKLINFVI